MDRDIRDFAQDTGLHHRLAEILLIMTRAKGQWRDRIRPIFDMIYPLRSADFPEAMQDDFNRMRVIVEDLAWHGPHGSLHFKTPSVSQRIELAAAAVNLYTNAIEARLIACPR